MATINNPDMKREIIEGAGIQLSVDKVPSQIAEKVVPVMEVNPKMLRHCNIARENTANNSTTTIYTIPADKEFYLCGFLIGLTATSTVQKYITITTEDGTSVKLGNNFSYSNPGHLCDFNTPIKLKTGTSITLTSAAAVLVNGLIWGFTTDKIQK